MIKLLRHPLNPMAAILSISLFYGISLAVLVTLVPLYMESLNISPAAIGFYLSLTGLIQISLRLPIGAVADNRGEKIILVFSVLAMAAAGVLYIYGSVLLAFILLAQILTGFSRAVFWPVSQSYLTKISAEEMGKNVAKFHSFASIGPIVGPLLTGLLLSLFDHKIAFICFIALALLCLPVVLSIPPQAPQAERKSFTLKTNLKALFGMLKNHHVMLSCLCQYAAGLPMALLGSFLPLYYYHVGMPPEKIGIVISSFGFFLLLANLLYAQVSRKIRHPTVWLVGMGGAGIAIAAIPFFAGVLPSIFFVGLMGIFSSPLRILPIVMTGQNTEISQRGLAIALTNTFWGISLWINPLLFGLIISATSFRFSFFILAVPLALLALFTGPLFKTVEARQ